MITATRHAARPLAVALRSLLVLTVLLGIAYPLAITGVGALLLPHQAAGSPVTGPAGAVVGSSLLGQSWTLPDGEANPAWFQSRPSVSQYAGNASGGSNLGPSSAELATTVQDRIDAVARLEQVAPSDVPADAVTASASGLDPDISPAYALLQVPRVARERGLDAAQVETLVRTSITGSDLGFLGEPRVNVLRLNLALAELG
ncbi:MAG TPA: potassium-transporting ATPase subunit C [Micrococcales bacterium]|uniref:potassium-transporting ATPase subunit KdpC n=1 Tax=Miniimonas arenae TaxID=676201 RepID=UPI000EEEBCBB|nr:potassium-transporting ATPase subunit KdpC [Miniimonas arenae]HCX83777.1 potassium-transporting ATPase subunit C [Micrococcales bacterium]